MDRVAIIGIGNPMRGDDGAGWAVIDALEAWLKDRLELRKIRGEIAELLDLFAAFPTLYLIDACTSGGTVGAWRRVDLLHNDPFLQERQTSTHGMGLAEAVSLAKQLDQIPSKLILYAIEGDRYNMSRSPSDAVARAAVEVAQRVLEEEEIQRCMKKV